MVGMASISSTTLSALLLSMTLMVYQVPVYLMASVSWLFMDNHVGSPTPM